MFRKIHLERLSLLCQNVATCLSAGLSVPVSLRTSVRSAADEPLRAIAEAAAERTASGMALADALEPDKDRLPSFFLPVVRCGEQSGRLDEAFQYLAQHSRLMVRPARLVRKMWLLPLAVLAAFSLIGIVVVALSAPVSAALAYAARELAKYAVFAAAAAVVYLVPSVKAAFDRVKLALPLVREIEIDLAVNRFFLAMGLVYASGGLRVERMIRLAAQSVGNLAIRGDLARAADVVEGGAAIGDAFQTSVFIAAEYREIVFTGDVSGKLEHAFETICRMTQQTLEHRVRMFNEYAATALKIAIVLAMALGAGSQISIILPGR